MKYCVSFFALMFAVVLCVGCGGKADDSASVASIPMAEAESYDMGLTFAAPQGWEKAGRSGGNIVKFKNPNLKGQSVFVKMPKKADIQTLATAEDAAKSGLKGDLRSFGKYQWMCKPQITKDKEENKFDDIVCTTVQFGMEYAVYVRGEERNNVNGEAIMASVLEKIQISDPSAAPKESAEVENFKVGEDNADFSL